MKISSSGIAMSSERVYDRKESRTVLGVAYSREKQEGAFGEAVSVSISEESKRQMENFKEEFRRLQQEERERAEMNQTKGAERNRVASKEDMMLLTLRKILEALRAMQERRRPDYAKVEREAQKQFGFSLSARNTVGITSDFFVSGNRGERGQVSNGTWTRKTVMSEFVEEREQTAFCSVGTVRTQDGREINFNVTVEMSRSFLQKSTIFTEDKNVVYTDPLVINLEGNVAEVSDQKFFFDLDGDGQEENISYLGKGSGFLALDKNGDGKINDGNELFGAKSGDGFSDLALYDQDGNGWIDENDDIFQNLKVWMKNEDGTDRLIDLKTAGVGAIYLGSVGTQFHLNSMENNQTNGVIQRTGIYLKENGVAGTIQHVDFAV